MSISRKQLIANRENAKKSTGPKTQKGKQIVKNNAFKHGLYSDTILINSPNLKESKTEYDYLYNALVEELQPKTEYQYILVRKIVNCLWRSRRVIVAETAIINRQIDSLENHTHYNDLTEQLQQIPDLPPEPGIVDDMQELRSEIARKRSDLIATKAIPRIEDSMNILHYEMRLDRQISQAYCQLRLLQLRDYSKSTSD